MWFPSGSLEVISICPDSRANCSGYWGVSLVFRGTSQLFWREKIALVSTWRDELPSR